MTSGREAKALRVAIIRKGRVVEERILRARQPVSIGVSPGNTFVVPRSDLPASRLLFPVEGGKRQLAFDDTMGGRIHAPGGAADLDELVASGRAKASGGRHLLALEKEAWGQVELGEVTVLFQLVAPPPARPRPSLPRGARGNRFRSMDRLFVLVLLASLAAHVSAYTSLLATPVREADLTLEEIPDRFAKLLIPERKPLPVQAQEAKQEPVAEKKPEEKKPEPSKTEAPEDSRGAAQDRAERQAAVARAVQQKGILRVLGSLGPAGGSRAVADVFGQGGAIEDVATALSGARGVALATEPGAVAERRGLGGGGAASIGDLGTSGGAGGKVSTGVKSELRVAGSVGVEDAQIDSADVDQAKLAAFVRARMGAVKACYENQLKRNPGLKGKIRIRFTILATGGLTDVAASENTLGSSDVADCIVSTMRAWRTPFRPSGTVSVEYPFVFSATES